MLRRSIWTLVTISYANETKGKVSEGKGLIKFYVSPVLVNSSSPHDLQLFNSLIHEYYFRCCRNG